jgi:hypothetical protein
VSPMWRHLEDHRRHRRSHRDGQDPHPSQLVRPGTAPIPGTALRSNPYGLILDRLPSRPVSSLSRQPPMARTRTRRQNAPKLGASDR